MKNHNKEYSDKNEKYFPANSNILKKQINDMIYKEKNTIVKEPKILPPKLLNEEDNINNLNQ